MNNSENKAKSKARQIPVELQGQVYLDPKYDPAFKELFDSEDALKDFLDAVLKLEGDDRLGAFSGYRDAEGRASRAAGIRGHLALRF